MPNILLSLDAGEAARDSIDMDDLFGTSELLLRFISGGCIGALSLSDEDRLDEDGRVGNNLESSLDGLRTFNLSNGASFGCAGTIAIR